MKLIIAGSRSIRGTSAVAKAVADSPFEISDITEVVSGRAPGVDQAGEKWAKANGIYVKLFPADWRQYGKSAGYLRNVEMAKYADALIAIWTGSSAGTRHMIAQAEKYRLKVFVYMRPPSVIKKPPSQKGI